MRRAVLPALALVLISAVMLAPIWFLFTGSTLKMAMFVKMPPSLFPHDPSPINYAWALSRPDVPAWALNTLLVVTATVALSTAVSAMAGYSFSTYRFPGKRALWALLMSGIMIPRISLIIPLFMVCQDLGINGTLASVVLPGVLAPASLYLARKYFDSVPRSMLESARIDGASEWQVLWLVVVPVSKPIVTALALFSGIAALQDWIWQALQLQDSKSATMLVGLMRAAMTRSMGDNDVNPVGHSMAVGVILLIPLLVAFLVANRYFVEGVSGAVKE